MQLWNRRWWRVPPRKARWAGRSLSDIAMVAMVLMMFESVGDKRPVISYISWGNKEANGFLETVFHTNH